MCYSGKCPYETRMGDCKFYTLNSTKNIINSVPLCIKADYESEISELKSKLTAIKERAKKNLSEDIFFKDMADGCIKNCNLQPICEDKELWCIDTILTRLKAISEEVNKEE